MATTTNYGWTTPDDTALVKDGASAIRTLGTSVDTTTKALNPSTTLGDIEYRSSTANTNTRLPLGTAGQVLKVNSGATAPEWATDATGMSNPMTTTGDTIYSSSGSTPARLGIGSTGQVLTVSGGLPSWATASSGGMTLLSTTTLSGSSVSLSSISQSYTDLYLYVYGITSTGDFKLRVAPNASTNISNQASSESDGASVRNSNQSYIFSQLSLNNWSSVSSNTFQLNIFNYSNTSGRKSFSASSGYGQTTTYGAISGGMIDTTSAISSLVLTLSAGTNFSTGTALLYGVK